jgi:protein-arginine kinase activator protein McsA
MSEEIKNDENTVEEEVILCHRCGRVLKGEKSKKLGYGPSCYATWKKERSQQIQLFDLNEGEQT